MKAKCPIYLFGELIEEDCLEIVKFANSLPILKTWSDIIGKKLIAVIDWKTAEGNPLLVFEQGVAVLSRGTQFVTISADHKGNPEKTLYKKERGVLGKVVIRVRPLRKRLSAIEIELTENHYLLVMCEGHTTDIAVISKTSVDIYNDEIIPPDSEALRALGQYSKTADSLIGSRAANTKRPHRKSQ